MTALALAGGAAAKAGSPSRPASINPVAAKNPRRMASRREMPSELYGVFIFSPSMPVKKFRAVDQSPGQVQQRFALLHNAGLRIRHHVLPFFIRRISRKDRQVEFVDLLAQRGFALQQTLQFPALLQLALDVTRIKQVQTLIGGGTIVALRLQTGVPRRAPELIQKRTGDAAIRQRD